VATSSQKAPIHIAPDVNSDVLGGVGAGESVTVLGRAPSGDWLYVRTGAGLEGFASQSYFFWPGDFEALPIREPPAWWTVTDPAESDFLVEYIGCEPHGLALGSVKGQVFDRGGNVVAGAQVEIWINGALWDSPENPATTNEEGWYEWVLVLGHSVQFSALYVDGQRVSFGPRDLEVLTKSGCFQHVNFKQQ
jgi:hypothetical protein